MGERPICSKCHDPDRRAVAKGLCHRCYKRERRKRMALKEGERATGKPCGDAAPLLIRCPDDPEIGMPMYVVGARFPRVDFHESLAWGCWPDGSQWMYVRRGEKRPSLWEVRGCALYEVGTSRAFYPSSPKRLG